LAFRGSRGGSKEAGNKQADDRGTAGASPGAEAVRLAGQAR